VDVEQPIGEALSRELAPGEAVEDALDHFIRVRHEKRVRDEGRDRAEELWAESARKHAAKQRTQARYEWHAYHTAQAARHRRNLEILAAYHEEQAASLDPEPEDAA
jgi:hypothetical protein